MGKNTQTKSRSIVLTPQLAKKYLKTMGANRTFSKPNFSKLLGVWQRGNWRIDGSSIRIDTTGQMRDGQHRCKLVIYTGQSIEATLVENVPIDAFETMDTGKPRSAADTLSVQNERYCMCLAAALARLDHYRWACKQQKKRKEPGGNIYVGTRDSFGHKEVRVLLKKNPKLRDSILFAQKGKDIATPGVSAFLHYILCEIDEKMAEDFMNLFLTGVGASSERDPAFVLYKTVFANKREARNQKFIAQHIIAITIKAWNAFRTDQKITRLKWRQNPKTVKEPMPMPK